MNTDIEMEDNNILNETNQVDEEIISTDQHQIVTLMTMLRRGDEYTCESIMEIDDNSAMEFEASSSVQATTAAGFNKAVEPRAPFTSNTAGILEHYRAKKAEILTGKPRENTYRIYSNKQVSDFINLICEQKTVTVAAAKTGIELKSAYRFKKIWNETLTIPEPLRRGPKKSNILNEEHLLHLITLIDAFSSITLDEMKASLVEKFPEVTISKTSFYRFVREECCLSIKKLEKVTAYRTLPETIQNRKQVVESWLQDPDIDFEKNCVFLDEAGFNLYLNRTRGWSKKGNTSKTTVPKAKGNNISIIGAICNKGVVTLSLRKPSLVSASKKRKSDGSTVKVKSRVGTRTEHFLGFLETLLNVLDMNNLHGYNIFMDNASIHTSQEVQDFITNRGYRCHYFPPYSPFLNGIELFWSKVKYGVKRKPFETNESLTPRIMEACSLVTQDDCRGWIRNAVSYFPRCLNEEIL